MNPRVFVLFGALLASAAGSQEKSLKCFELSDPTVRQILKKTAETQYRYVQPIEEPTPVRQPAYMVKNEPGPETSPVQTAPQRPAKKPQRQGPISALIDVLIESALDIPDDFAADQRAAYLALCQQLDQPQSPTKRSVSCPSAGIVP